MKGEAQTLQCLERCVYCKVWKRNNDVVHCSERNLFKIPGSNL